MSYFRGVCLAGVSLLAMSVTAHSADLYGSMGGRGSLKDDYIPVAPRGCPTWYARVDGGYSTFDRPAMSQIGIDDLVWARANDTGSIGGGLGYYFSCNIRGDVTVDHRFDSDMRGFNANPWAPNYGYMKWGYESTAILANLYYDFNPGGRITPYVGVGLGTAYNRFNAGKGVVGAGALEDFGGGPQPSGAIGTPTTVGGASSWHVAGAAMAGFVFNVTDRLKFDTGYRFLYLGAGKTGQTANSFGGTGGPITVDNLHAHEFRIGLRYDIR